MDQWVLSPNKYLFLCQWQDSDAVLEELTPYAHVFNQQQSGRWKVIPLIQTHRAAKQMSYHFWLNRPANFSQSLYFCYNFN